MLTPGQALRMVTTVFARSTERIVVGPMGAEWTPNTEQVCWRGGRLRGWQLPYL